MSDEQPTKPKPTDYEIGHGKPPKSTQFKRGNPGRPRGSGKRTVDFAAALKAELGRPVQGTKNNQPVTREVGEVLGQRLRSIALSGGSRDIEAFMRIVRQHAPDVLKQPDPVMHLVFHHAPGSTVPLPTSDLYLELDQ